MAPTLRVDILDSVIRWGFAFWRLLRVEITRVMNFASTLQNLCRNAMGIVVRKG